ncbi:VanZ family protein [Chungangia koreensis]|uniref:VanZ family protein n=1 Tax=Chungangia koreensis TaxID=752657 RepID=A0ABV8X534_9LACT
MDTIIEYIASMFSYLIIAMPTFVVIRFLWLNLRNERITPLHEAGVVLFFSFIIGLFALTFDQDASDQQTAVNSVPFKVFVDTFNAIQDAGFWEPFTINLLGNIIVFMPIGLLLPLLWGRFNAKRAILTGFLISLFIESTQLALDRSSDIDDLILNTFGALIGYGIYRCIPAVTAKRFKQFSR